MNGRSLRGPSFTLRHAGILAVLLLAAGCDQGAGQSASGGGVATEAHAAMTVDHVVATGQVCAPTGKHANHQAFACTVCHQCAGTLSFDPAVAGSTAAFDATTKSCSSVKCHSVASGTFTYSKYDWGSDSYYDVNVPYGGSGGAGTANWYATGGSSCNACHGYPPTYNGVAYTWHSGAHGGGNTCQLCHPDATGAYVYAAYLSTSGGLITSCPPNTYCAAPGNITVPSMHGNGTVDVSPQWSSRCFGCH